MLAHSSVEKFDGWWAYVRPIGGEDLLRFTDYAEKVESSSVHEERRHSYKSVWVDPNILFWNPIETHIAGNIRTSRVYFISFQNVIQCRMG